MNWSTLEFGKYRGKTLPQVLFRDPDWFFWAMEKDVFRNKGRILYQEAKELSRKARNIKIPSRYPPDSVVEYWIHEPTDKFVRLGIVPRTRLPHMGSSPTFRKETIDLSVPRQIAPYDKLGCKCLLDCVINILFEYNYAKMTKKRCEDFFDNSNNFIFP